MNRNKIVSAVKRQEEEKVGFSLKLPISVKEELQKISEKESISMNSLIVATLQSMIDDECGQQLLIAKTLLTEYRLKVAKERYDLLTYGINKKIGQIAVMINEMKDIEERASKKVIKVTDEIKSKDFLIERIKEEIVLKASKITDLEDVLTHRKNPLENKKGNN